MAWKDWRVGGIPRHFQVANDLLKGHIRMCQRSLYSGLHAAQQRSEGLPACTSPSPVSVAVIQTC